MKIVIKTDSDDYDCETCGTSWASGGTVHVDGKLIINLPAIAHCYSGRSFAEDELLVLALRKLGHEIIVDGFDYHITCSADE